MSSEELLMSSSPEAIDFGDGERDLVSKFQNAMATASPNKGAKGIEMKSVGESDQSDSPTPTSSANHIAGAVEGGASPSLTCREGQRSPMFMRRGTSVTYGNVIFFNSSGSHQILAYKMSTSDNDTEWFEVAKYPYKYFSLAVVGVKESFKASQLSPHMATCTVYMYIVYILVV